MNNPKPFLETKEENYIVREFSPDVEMEDLVWHRDYEDRLITFLNQNDWKYQEDNKLPIPCQGQVFIPRGLYHRIHKGTTKLIVKIEFKNLSTLD